MAKVDPEHPNARQHFHAFLSSGRDPVKLAQLMVDLHTVAEADSGAAFDELCAFADKLAATVDPKQACEAARVEVEKKPTKPVDPKESGEVGTVEVAANKLKN